MLLRLNVFLMPWYVNNSGSPVMVFLATLDLGRGSDVKLYVFYSTNFILHSAHSCSYASEFSELVSLP